MKLSVLIVQAQKILQDHGDAEVFTTAFDYPEEATSIIYIDKGDSYVPCGSVQVV